VHGNGGWGSASAPANADALVEEPMACGLMIGQEPKKCTCQGAGGREEVCVAGPMYEEWVHTVVLLVVDVL